LIEILSVIGLRVGLGDALPGAREPLVPDGAGPVDLPGAGVPVVVADGATLLDVLDVLEADGRGLAELVLRPAFVDGCPLQPATDSSAVAMQTTERLATDCLRALYANSRDGRL
jgi:hypothetical protein